MAFMEGVCVNAFNNAKQYLVGCDLCALLGCAQMEMRSGGISMLQIHGRKETFSALASLNQATFSPALIHGYGNNATVFL